jgi:ABC-type Fe3+-siderophore transport system permease subunit
MGGSLSLVDADSYRRADIWTALILGCIFSYPLVPALLRWLTNWSRGSQEAPLAGRQIALSSLQLCYLALVLVASTASLAARTHNPFLYFRF